MFSEIDSGINSSIGNGNTIPRPVNPAIETPPAPAEFAHEFKLDISAEEECPPEETSGAFHDEFDSSGGSLGTSIGGVTEEKCRECGQPRGHSDKCSIGMKELEEWTSSFKGVTYEHYDDTDTKPFMAPFEDVDVGGPPEFKSFILPLSPEFEAVKTMLIRDVLKAAYNFATTGGKIKLTDLMKETKTKTKDISTLLQQNIFETLRGKELLTEEERAKHIEKLRQSVKFHFDKAFAAQKATDHERKNLIIHLVAEMDEAFKDIELKDEGATKSMKMMVARMFLPTEEFNKIFGDNR